MRIDAQRSPGPIVAMLLMIVALPVGALSAAAPPAIEIIEPDPATTAEAPEGHLVVRWRPDVDRDDLRFELEISSQNDFTDVRTRSTGSDRSSFLSGLAPGHTRLRVRAVTADSELGPWSAPLDIDVQYPSSKTVISLMSLGSVLLLATLVAIVIGHRRTTCESFLAHGDNV